jgi:hypothetical protein
VNSKKSLRKNSDKNCWKYIIYWLEREKKAWSLGQRINDAKLEGTSPLIKAPLTKAPCFFFLPGAAALANS